MALRPSSRTSSIAAFIPCVRWLTAVNPPEMPPDMAAKEPMREPVTRLRLIVASRMRTPAPLTRRPPRSLYSLAILLAAGLRSCSRIAKFSSTSPATLKAKAAVRAAMLPSRQAAAAARLPRPRPPRSAPAAGAMMAVPTDQRTNSPTTRTQKCCVATLCAASEASRNTAWAFAKSPKSADCRLMSWP